MREPFHVNSISSAHPRTGSGPRGPGVSLTYLCPFVKGRRTGGSRVAGSHWHRLHQGKGRCRVPGEAWEPLTGPTCAWRVQPAECSHRGPFPHPGVKTGERNATA